MLLYQKWWQKHHGGCSLSGSADGSAASDSTESSLDESDSTSRTVTTNESGNSCPEYRTVSLSSSSDTSPYNTISTGV